MKEADKTNFEARLKSASDAKKALLEKFKPRPAAVAPVGRSRAAQRALELTQVRAARVTAKAARKAAVAAAETAVVVAAAAAEAAALESRRGERKERKQLTKAEAKAKRDAKYAARKARQ